MADMGTAGAVALVRTVGFLFMIMYTVDLEGLLLMENQAEPRDTLAKTTVNTPLTR